MRANEFLNICKSDGKQRMYKLGMIDPNYAEGRPRIIFDGENVSSEKRYPYLASYTPERKDRVLLLRVANSYVVLGKVI